MKKITFLMMIACVIVVFTSSACKKCQTCKIDYTYEYSDTNSNGVEVTVTEEGTETSEEECASNGDLDNMEDQWNEDATKLKKQLEGQGANNISTTVTCDRK